MYSTQFKHYISSKIHLRDARYVDWKLEEYHYLRMRRNIISKINTSSIWMHANYILKGII